MSIAYRKRIGTYYISSLISDVQTAGDERAAFARMGSLVDYGLSYSYRVELEDSKGQSLRPRKDGKFDGSVTIVIIWENETRIRHKVIVNESLVSVFGE